MQIMGKIIVTFDFDVPDGRFRSLDDAYEWYQAYPEELYEKSDGEEVVLEDTFPEPEEEES